MRCRPSSITRSTVATTHVGLSPGGRQRAREEVMGVFIEAVVIGMAVLGTGCRLFLDQEMIYLKHRMARVNMRFATA